MLTKARALTSLRFCCASKMTTAGEAREPDDYRDSSNRLLCSARFGLFLTALDRRAVKDDALYIEAVLLDRQEAPVG